MDQREVTLQTINNGAILDLFSEELDALLENIADDNTDAEKARSITIKVTVKPTKDRAMAETKVEVNSKLAPLKPHESFVLLSSDGRRVKAYTADPGGQPDLPGVGDNIRGFPVEGQGV
ncbi:hypothetical protein [Spirochaeta africana]|uniref:Uncharacterized protein n=1 Tax=Spirochaeta africana (strain ATCC 700263 / DSM 8902 / Z-7692) TaxID=889378 RepID=H9UJF6_SPIAZ|nr:hypothetical protein [Spirochaeta africana]AFG37649.1 hypothetical protein Spiaf_1591 [Spirochaeta africana DSM 8902]